MKVKLLAEQGNISSVSVESDQIVLRFRDGTPPADPPLLNSKVRIGKTGLWMPYHSLPNWRQTLIEVLQALSVGQLI